ncbi:PTS sugar transporter subunit IIB [uncultured Brachyspira sp.]|uniref:PTS sugar transporter subunit IIB n=1 Tax=uncultured Brachyspira sp. TaxID=221953 RepID=UPI0026250331|nr:PTS sugar transporter subunit IIB [uncultured Brachyspira sp.]
MKKILLLCSAGMSTSMIVKKMQDKAKADNIDAEIEAASVSRFDELIDNYDIFLLGPQVKYLKTDLVKKANSKGKVLDVIDFKYYGKMDGAKILEFALGLTL